MMAWCKYYTTFALDVTRVFLISFLYASLIQTVNSLYEDQVGKFDWRQQYIGKVKYAYIDPTIAGTHKFIVATEENVIACLSTRTGSVMWRQVLEKGQPGAVDAISEDGDLITVNGAGQFIRSWDLNTGVLQWETSFPTHPTSQSMSILKFSINSQQKEVIKVEIIPKSYVRVSIYSLTRASLKTSEAISAVWLDTSSNCNFVSSSYFVCIDKVKHVLYLLPIKDSGSFIAVPMKSLGIEITNQINNLHAVAIPYQGSSEQPVFGLQIDEQFMLFQIHPPDIKLVKLLPIAHKIMATTVDGKLIIFYVKKLAEDYAVRALEVESNTELTHLEGSFKLPSEQSDLEEIHVLPYTKKDHTTSYKLLMLLSDYSVLIIHQQGRLVWSREEALSNIISAEMLDLPLSETDANIEQEFEHPEAGVISMVLTRLKSQVYLFQSFVLQKLIDFKGIEGTSDEDKKLILTRDTFGLHKIIVVLTEPGKFFGIDNFSGLIIWSHYGKEFKSLTVNDKPHVPFFVQRTTAHFPYPPICTVLGKHKISNKSFLFSFDPITGVPLEKKVLPYDVIQIMSSGTLSKHYLRDILLLDSNLNVHSYPDSKSVSKHKDAHYMFTANVKNGTLTGYSFVDAKNDNRIQAVEVWKVQLPQPIIGVATKQPFEHVHSQGRVMGDRSVLYKYLNPNLAAVFTEGYDPVAKSFCNVYLVDTVTGSVVYSAIHKRCKQPMQVVHTENWLVYSYYNDKSRRVEVSSLELFEGISQSNTTAFSSFSPPPLPLVEHQTFIFPSAIEAMTDTVTERGMTSKHILIALPTGGILELPKSFLDPRRPINPLPEHREEGLIPYIPELPIMTEGIINYNQSVINVRGIKTAPSGLESTCLVFVYGLDLLYTRVTPSKTFDILKDDFDHYLICVVLLGLLVLSYTTKRLAARKTLRAAWK